MNLGWKYYQGARGVCCIGQKSYLIKVNALTRHVAGGEPEVAVLVVRVHLLHCLVCLVDGFYRQVREGLVRDMMCIVEICSCLVHHVQLRFVGLYGVLRNYE